ncbi:hypothetical protein WJX79_006315 [Trebouxia sp. C0005]
MQVMQQHQPDANIELDVAIRRAESAESARAEEASARQQADQRAQQAAFQHAEELQKSRANDRANSFEQQAKHAQLAAQQAQHDAHQKASRVGELERLVEQLMQQAAGGMRTNDAGHQAALVEAKMAVATARDAEQAASQTAVQEVSKRHVVEQQLAVLQQTLQQLQAQLEALQAESSKQVAAAEARAAAAGACAAEEVKRRDELVQTHAAELADLQQRLQAAQEGAEDREVVANKLASAKAWLADLRKQQKQLDIKRDTLAIATTDIQRRQERVQKAEARLPANILP